MATLSVVVITRNEAHNITDCILSAKKITQDIIVVDCGSVDNTVELAAKTGAKVIPVDWQCYGHSRNTGALQAKNDWILALDADERISPALADRLNQLVLCDEQTVYEIKRQNFFGGQLLRFGTLGFESVPRLYCKKVTQWDLVPVHEKLKPTNKSKRIGESILHYGISNIQQHLQKKEHYALLSACKYKQQGKKATFLKRFVSPAFNGIKSYVFQFGFADGKKGREIASAIIYYTWLKYKYLHQLSKKEKWQPAAIAEAECLPNL